jgi:hypothetical protein
VESTTIDLVLEVSQAEICREKILEMVDFYIRRTSPHTRSSYDIHSISSLWCILCLSRCKGHESICQYLLEAAGERATDLANAKSWKNDTPLMFAVWAKALDVAKLLISYGADPHCINDKGCHTAHWAVAGGDADVCEYLYNVQGVDFYAPDNLGNTPLHYAISYGQDNVVKWILKTFYSDPDKAATVLQDEEVNEFLAAKKWAPDDEINAILLSANLFGCEELESDTTTSRQ